MASMNTKTAPKPETPNTLIVNPQINQKEYDCVDVSMNSKGDAYIVSLSMFAGAPFTDKFKPDPKKDEEVEWTDLGSITLDDTFMVGDILCQFKVVKGSKGDRLAIRPVSSRSRNGSPKPTF